MLSNGCRIDSIRYLVQKIWPFLSENLLILGSQRGSEEVSHYLLKNSKNSKIFIKLPNLGCQILATIDSIDLKIYQTRELTQIKALVKNWTIIFTNG